MFFKFKSRNKDKKYKFDLRKNRILNFKSEEDRLRYIIRNLRHEWNKEKELYDDIMYEKFIEQKVDFVIGGIDISEYNGIARPLSNLSEKDADNVCKACYEVLKKSGYECNVYKSWDDQVECYRINIEQIK